MTADHYVHYTQSAKADELKSVCGKQWEWITDAPTKVNCPECLEKMKGKTNGNL